MNLMHFLVLLQKVPYLLTTPVRTQVKQLVP